jgi:hypothetical protein
MKRFELQALKASLAIHPGFWRCAECQRQADYWVAKVPVGLGQRLALRRGLQANRSKGVAAKKFGNSFRTYLLGRV